MKEAWHDINYSLTYQDAAEILRLVNASATTASLDLEVGSFRLRLSRDAGPARAGSAAPQADSPARPIVRSDDDPAGTHQTPAAAVATDQAAQSGVVDVLTPTLGVFYRRPSPDAKPFVVEGDVVHEDDQIGLLEVMKLYTPVVAGVNGRVVEILASDSALVEHGQVLMRVDTGQQG